MWGGWGGYKGDDSRETSRKGGVLQPVAVVPIVLALALEAVAPGAGAEHAPVLLEQAEVGGVVGLAVACCCPLTTITLSRNPGKVVCGLAVKRSGAQWGRIRRHSP